MPTDFAVVDGLKLVYEREGSGPPIVFIHGFNGSVVQWETLIPFLMTDHTCIAVEMRGHGRSDRSGERAYRTKDFIGEMTGFVEQVADRPAVLIGQSLGGIVSFGVSAARPDLVHAVYSEDAVPANAGDQPDPSVSAIMDVLRVVKGLVVAKQEQGQSVYQFASALGLALPEWAATDPAGLVRFARWVGGTDPAAYDMIGDPDDPLPLKEVRAIEAGIRCPVHVAYGDTGMGGIVTAEHIAGLQSAGMDVTATHYAGAGHVITSTHAREMLADIRTFLRRVEG
jgi:pimeloyl-ACP methyl ester carboxylesterase